MLSTNEITKVNDLYSKIDVLTAENNANKLHRECHETILARLDAIDQKLEQALTVKTGKN